MISWLEKIKRKFLEIPDEDGALNIKIMGARVWVNGREIDPGSPEYYGAKKRIEQALKEFAEKMVEVKNNIVKEI